MSVYTEVERDDLIAFLNDYAVGQLVSYQGISDGIENTNYFVTTEQGEFVLTLFEQHEFDELGYFLDVMTFFYQHNIPSAHPAADKEGRYLKTLCDRPAALVLRLSGRGVNDVASLSQCQAIGDVLAKMHVAGQQFDSHRPTQRGPEWRQQIAATVLPLLDPASAAFLQDELSFQANYANLDCPSGLTHSDLFRDNALFDGDELRGIIDFYYACDEYLLYDLAVAINDWCVNEDGLIDVSLSGGGMLKVSGFAGELLEYLKNNNGQCNIHDKSTPEQIKHVFGVSKKTFKSGVGNLLKNKKIELISQGIKLI